LQRVLSGKRGGDMLTLTVYRGGRKIDVKIKLGEAPRQL
jgi:S1-C subfamily serine protease